MSDSKRQRTSDPAPLIYIALDVDSESRALELARSLQHPIVGFKIGPRLALKAPGLVAALAHFGAVFLDCKFLDIPSTMEASIRAAFDLGASSCTIHALAGPKALKHLAELKRELNETSRAAGRAPFQIHAVTILTSFAQSTLPSPLKQSPIAELVSQLVSDVFNSGLNSIVCSVDEAIALRQLWTHEQLHMVCPGIRFEPGKGSDDQERVATPKFALQSGASSLVIGRPIIAAENPRLALDRCLENLT